ncbi:MAG: FtsH protease activity modulator HflK [Candidatus Omnitrophota bacterium]|nr:MAG: FtsH protease activity modulator HflK [Candidatus Omnitrophota bacterium]
MNFEGKTPDEIIYDFQKKLKLRMPKTFPLFSIVGIIAALIVVFTSFYTIQPNEVGVLLRLGKFVKNTQPGLHFKLPFGIDRVYPVKVEYIYKEEFGFRTRTAGVRTIYDSKSYADESLMLSGDLNVLDLEWIVQFKVKDPFYLLFKIRDVRKTLRDISESVMRKVVGDYTFNEVLTTKRLEINNDVQKQIQQILDSYETGVQIVTVKLQDVNPPDPVKPAFNEVNEAKQEREKLINQAWEIYNQKIPQAKGEAAKVISKAEGYALEKINNAEGDAKRFLLLREEYARAKDITTKRLYLENMSDILTKAGKKYIVDPEEKGILPLLKLEDED